MQLAQRKERGRELREAVAKRDAAVAELKRTKKSIKEMQSVGACKHAAKTFTLESLQKKKHRFELLDRLALLKAGLSPAQKNDWVWWKDAWDEKMVADHKKQWPEVFAGWMQHVLNDVRSNAFSLFVRAETERVFSEEMAVHLPGIVAMSAA